MTVEEIFSTLAEHMQEGLLVHQQLADIYSFLNLCGYKKCHEYHYYEESRNYRCLCNFYMEQYYKLIPPKEPKTKRKELIPSSWYKYEKIDVDANTKRTAVKAYQRFIQQSSTLIRSLAPHSFCNHFRREFVPADWHDSSLLKYYVFNPISLIYTNQDSQN